MRMPELLSGGWEILALEVIFVSLVIFIYVLWRGSFQFPIFSIRGLDWRLEV